ncbi:MAG: acyl CoA:acetate/3-ketoacid CoA transferase [Candidatus Rokubacteria bacterium]|nr:acyl CoA:acetate/3-ketoacid CoA transferase [Candidatus Rokubacteria bacterium]
MTARARFLGSAEAAELVKDGDLVALEGSGGGVVEPDELFRALGARFRKTGSPRGITVFHCFGIGDRRAEGLEHFAPEGLVARAIGAHFGMSPAYTRQITEGKIEAYNLPLGPMSHMLRAAAARQPGVLTHVGLHTFVDPRVEGGKLTPRTRKDLVEVVQMSGREWLFYPAPSVQVALIRGTSADPAGNISMEEEAAILQGLNLAMAARASGGTVIAQVRRRVDAGSIPPKAVAVPGALVDAVVVYPGQRQTWGGPYDPSLAGEAGAPRASLDPIPLDERKIVARRAALELQAGAVINLGYGMADGVARVAAEEGIADRLTFSVEQGLWGGVPASGLVFGSVHNPEACIPVPSQMDFYHGGGLDLAFLGLAEADAEGNVNVSRFHGALAGCGGFIDITQNSRTVVFCGAFTAGGLRVAIEDGKLRILQEGKHAKFLPHVEQITFSGRFARERGQRVRYVTERAVFGLDPDGMTLLEVAPGVDVGRDVLAHMGFRPKMAARVPEMDPALFAPTPLGLAARLL